MKRKPDLGRSATVRPTKQPTALGGRTGRDMATVDLRQAARTAWEAKESDRIAAARTALGEVIGADNAAEGAVDVADIVEFAGGYTVAFVDADGVNVAVTVRDSGAEVRLVQQAGDGAWTSLGQVTSLAHLWQLIDEHLPAPAYPEWVQPTGAHDAYALGDKVTWNGKTWESTVDANVWEPGVSGWREVAA